MLSEPQSIVYSSFAADEAVRNLNTSNPQVAQPPQEKVEEKHEDVVRVHLSPEASELLQQLEGESLAVAAVDETDAVYTDFDNADVKQATLAANMEAMSSVLDTSGEVIEKMAFMVRQEYDALGDNSSGQHILDLLA
ncbi:MAG: hypothetical protein JXR78_10735 [Victivallales bacterium]|nr:hypothetical protein [Victivallales bacterium]